MNANNPVEQQLEYLQIFIVQVESHEDSPTVSDESRQSYDAEKGQQLQIVEVLVVNIQVHKQSDGQRNVCQKVKGEQTAEIFLGDATLAQDDLEKF